MDKTIVCLIDMFSLQSKLDLVSAHSIVTLGKFNNNEISQIICDYCYMNNIYNVRILGVPSFVEKYVKDIYLKEINKYNKNKIKIEVN